MGWVGLTTDDLRSVLRTCTGACPYENLEIGRLTDLLATDDLSGIVRPPSPVSPLTEGGWAGTDN